MLASLTLSNSSFFNLSSDIPLSPQEAAVIGLGLKFVAIHPMHKDALRRMWFKSSDSFTRRIALRYHFRDAEATPHCTSNDLSSIVVPLRNPHWTPTGPEPFYYALDKYKFAIRSRIDSTLQSLQVHSNPLHKMILNTYQSLRQRTDIIIRPADKNLGTCIMSPDTYRSLCKDHLKDDTVYRLCDTD